MNPQTPCCHNPQGPARGQVGQGNIRVQSQAEPRYRWTPCGQTFAATTETPFSRWQTTADRVTLVLTRLSHGGPLPALVAACGVDERTVAAWLTRVGPHGERVHQQVVQQGGVAGPPVQADEWWGKLVGRRVWMALAVPSRLGLGGDISPQRDVVLITRLRQRVRACARTLALVGWVEGLASSVTAWLRVFRYPVHTGRPGRPRVVLEQGVLLGQMVKRYGHRRVVSVERRVVQGPSEAVATVLAATGGGIDINTADIERLNTTCRASLVPLARRGRAIAHPETPVTARMWLVGGADNVCWRQERWRVAAPAGAPWKGQERTPAMAAGLTHHRWTMLDRFHSQVPLSPWVVPKRRGRPPKRVQQPTIALAA